MSVRPLPVRPRRLAAALAVLIASTGSIASLQAHAADVPAHAYDVPASHLTETLSRFAAAAGVALSFDGSQIGDRASPGLHGTYSVDEGFARLLAGSGLQAVAVGDGTYVLRQASVPHTVPASPVASAAPPRTGSMRAPTTDLAGLHVNGVVGGLVALRSTAGTKGDTPLIETPQAISVVTRAQMDVQNIQSVSQALRYTSGTNPEQRGDNTDGLEYIYSRGFQVDEYLNGLRWFGANFNITSMDSYLLDRIELLHGPSSVLYGQGSPGGMLVLTSKLPTETAQHEVMLQTGNHGRAQAAIDLSGPLDDRGQWLGRFTMDTLDTGTQVNRVRQERVAVAASATWKASDNTSLTLMANYQRDPDAGIFNYVPAEGTVLPGRYRIPRSVDLGDPNYDTYSKTQTWVGYALTHRFNDTWSLVQNVRYLHNSTTIHSVGFGDNGVYADDGGLARGVYVNYGTINSIDADTQLHGIFSTGEVDHQLTTGLDVQRNRDSHVFNADIDGLTPSINPNAPVYGQAMPDPNFVYGTSSINKAKQEGIYLQDQLHWNQWTATLGAREDWTSENSRSLKTGAVTNQKASAFTWRAGLSWLSESGLAPYVSYSKSFAPTLGLDANGNAFKPTTGTQAEAGIKYQPNGVESFITLAAYELKQQNVQTPDPVNARLTIQTGEVRSRGIELEGHAQLGDDLQLIGSYTYNALKNTRSNSGNLDKVPAGNPRHMVAGWIDYRMPDGALQGLKIGAGVRYVGKSYGDALNDFSVPAYTLVDLSLHYDLGERWAPLQGWTTSLTASNLTDRRYVTCTGETYCTFGAGRLLLANVRYRW
nr:TonB-dependent siderophore receptor [Luteibacter rhizovicinus]